MKLFAFLFGITMFCGWVTHIIWSISTIFGSKEMIMNEAVIAILGAIVAPLGAIHGITLWF